MGLFKKTTVAPTIKEKTLAEELSSIQSVFKQAHTKAITLKSKIKAKKEVLNTQIERLNQELADTTTVEQNTTNFIENLEKFVS